MTSRRRFLQVAGVGGLTISVGSVLPVEPLVGLAGAQTSSDGEVAAFLESVELALVEAYTVATQPEKLTTPEVIEVAKSISSHHRDHANAFGAAAVDAATGAANPMLLDELRAELEDAGTEDEVLERLFDFENAATATHLFVSGAFERVDDRALAASVLPVEAQHAVAVGALLELDSSALVPVFETGERAWEPDRYPVAE